MPKPELATVPPFYHNYIRQVQQEALTEAIRINTGEVLSVFDAMPPQKWNYRYAEGKWTVKELLQHMIDTERIFCYRALRFARKDQTPLPGFDENLYASTANAGHRNEDELLAEFKAVREASAFLFRSFDDEQLSATGVSNNNPISVNAIGFILAGHAKHHLNILQERYL